MRATVPKNFLLDSLLNCSVFLSFFLGKISPASNFQKHSKSFEVSDLQESKFLIEESPASTSGSNRYQSIG